MQTLSRVWILAVYLIGATTAAWGQTSSARVTGSVTDPAGAAIPEATITLTNRATGVTTQANTNAAGIYTVAFLNPGPYELSVEAAGFKRYTRTGITLETAKYLVEQYGTMMIGSDTSGLEVNPPPKGSDTFIPVHRYLLIEQGVHILEFHNLEELARDKIYVFCYVASTNKIAGTTAGFALRPLALR